MNKEDLRKFFEHRPAVMKTVFAEECGVSHSTIKGYILNGRIPADRAEAIDRVMRAKYNYDYKAISG